MSEFMFGFVCGALAILGASLVLSFLAMMFAEVGAREDDHPIDQPDIRLTKIKSDYVRTFNHD